MGKITVLGNSTGGVSGALTFGEGLNFNSGQVTTAVDDPSNMLYNPGFEQSPALTQWTQSPAATWSLDTVIFFQGLKSAKTSTANAMLIQFFHCDPGDQFTGIVYARSSAGATGTGDVSIRFLDASQAIIVGFGINITIPAGTTWLSYEVPSLSAPATASYVQFRVQENPGSTGTWYFDNASMRRIAYGNNIALGVIDNAHLVSGQTSVTVTSGLPTLPSANYPVGIVIFNTADGYLYKNVSNVWKNPQSPGDLLAGTLAAGIIYAGQISAAQVNAGIFNGLQLILNLNSVTTTISNIPGFSFVGTVGMRVLDVGGHYGTLGEYGMAAFYPGVTLPVAFCGWDAANGWGTLTIGDNASYNGIVLIGQNSNPRAVIGGVAGFTGTVNPIHSITVKGGFVTSAS